MILKEFAYQPKLNGFQNWIETFYEIVDHLACTSNCSGMMAYTAREQGGRGAQYILAEQLTDEFEVKFHQDYNIRFDAGEWNDTIEAFLKEKEAEHLKTLPHGVSEPEKQYINDYECPDCGETWTDIWTAMCDDECPNCGTTCSPTDSQDY